MNRRSPRSFVLAAAVLALPVLAPAQEGMSGPNRVPVRQEDSSMEDRIGAQVDTGLQFTDERGYPFKLQQLFPGARPVILDLGYYACPDMCGQVIHGMVEALNAMPLEPGVDYELLNVSIDPRETPEIARQRKEHFLMQFTKVGADAAWRFCVGDEGAIQALTRTVGFRYFWSEHENRYDHPAALVVLTPQGRVSRVLMGLSFDPGDLRLAVVEASEGRLGTFWDKVQLSCLTWDPKTRTYALTAMTVMKIGGILTVLGLAAMIGLMIRKERKRLSAANA